MIIGSVVLYASLSSSLLELKIASVSGMRLAGQGYVNGQCRS